MELLANRLIQKNYCHIKYFIHYQKLITLFKGKNDADILHYLFY